MADARYRTAPGEYRMPSETARAYARRAGAKSRAVLRYTIEGVPVNKVEIAARLGIHVHTAASRLKREQAKAGPVTWAGLAVRGEDA